MSHILHHHLTLSQSLIFSSTRLFQVAWDNKDLGAPLFGEDIDQLRANIKNYHSRFRNPENILLCAVNVDHKDLVRLSQQAFDELEQAVSSSTTGAESEGGSVSLSTSAASATESKPHTPAPYVGGFRVVPSSLPPEMCKSAHVALGWHLEGGWDSPDLIAATVLQSLLGGGGSFSTGGPGKGMHSRLFLKVEMMFFWE